MGKEQILKILQDDRIRQLKALLDITLKNATDEDNGTDEENDMYADMENLKESIEYYLESEGL